MKTWGQIQWENEKQIRRAIETSICDAQEEKERIRRKALCEMCACHYCDELCGLCSIKHCKCYSGLAKQRCR